MTIRTRLALWYAVIFSLSLLLMYPSYGPGS